MSEEQTVDTTVKETVEPKRGLNNKSKAASGRVRRGRPKKDKVAIKDLDWSKMLVSEILQLVSSAKTKEEKIELLIKLKCPALMKILVINYNPQIISLLPEGEVPYKPNEVPVGTGAHTSLHTEARRLHYFFKGGYDELSQIKREQIFIEMLEGLHKDDAQLLVYAKDKKLQELFRITENVIKEAYPEFLSKVN